MGRPRIWQRLGYAVLVLVLWDVQVDAQTGPKTSRFKMPFSNSEPLNTALSTIDTNMRSSAEVCFGTTTTPAVQFCGTGTATGAEGTNCSATENKVSIPQPVGGKIANLSCVVPAALGGGKTYAVTVNDNTVGTTLTCSISGASATTCQDNTHAPVTVANDVLDFSFVNTGGGAGALACCFQVGQSGGMP